MPQSARSRPDQSAVTLADPTAAFAAIPAPPPPLDAVDLLAETIVPITKLAQELDKCSATIYRWIRPGLLCAALDGTRTRETLESFKLGAVTYTSREAFARFVRRTQPAGNPEPEPTRKAVPRRQRELASVDQELDRAGL